MNQDPAMCIPMTDCKTEEDKYISESEEKLLRRCFDKVDDMCGDDVECVMGPDGSIDCRRDGKVSITKLKVIIARMEDMDNPLSMGPVVDKKGQSILIGSTIDEIDKDDNGFIEYNEFKEFVTENKRRHIYNTQASR